MGVQPSLGEWLKELPYTLCLSSGFFGFFAHAGFVSAVAESDLFPEIISGASAGALIGGSWGAGLDPLRLRDELARLKTKDFWDPGLGAGLLRGKLFHDLLTELLPVQSLENHEIPTRISTYDVFNRRTRVFKRGNTAQIIRASCAVPVMFQPVWIEKRPYLDGGILDRPAMQAVKPGRRVLYHHLPSRSWWRRSGGVGTQIPRRGQMATVAIDSLPRVNPAQLSEGMKAFHEAYQAGRDALKRPVALQQNCIS